MIEKIELDIFGPSEDPGYEIRFRSGYTCKVGTVPERVVIAHLVIDRRDYIGFQLLEAPFDERTAKLMCLLAESVILAAFAETGVLSESADPLYTLKLFRKSGQGHTSSTAIPADGTAS